MEISLKDLKELLGQGQQGPTISKQREQETFLEIGKNYLIRTVTMYYTGVLVSINKNEFLLGDAAWIANTGSFSESLKTCEFSEVQMFPKDKLIPVGRGAFLDACIIDKLPTENKS